jgi:predicted nucleotidyltransferase
MLIKMVVVKCLRKNNQQALYRKKPRAANITGLCLMCWNIALGAGLMLGRLTQFLLAAAFWIGRTDAQFLDDDVKLFGYNFDKIAINFRKDIIVHEAHRHPFLDRIGGMYLMRHAYGKEFGSNAGARWRQLFCVALMPWYKKFRSLRNLELVLEEKAAKAAAASVVDGSFAPVLTAEEMIQLSAFRQRRKALTSTTNVPPKKVEYPTVSQRGEYMASF